MQAKKLTNPRCKVSPKTIGEVVRGNENYGSNATCVVTNRGFTSQAYEESVKCKVRLLGHRDLLKLVSGQLQ